MAKKDAKQAAKSDGGKKASGPSKGSAKGPAKSAASAEGDSFSAGDFAQGTREELSKVIWPTRQQLISESAAVILMVGLSATLIYFVDKLFGFVSSRVF